ncbi:MAG TPA: glycoside hydrolase family 2 protein [Spirochaetia bacterium]|nr:glycoside hydrolase family 2 protein [Spirochaetia bacterium]
MKAIDLRGDWQLTRVATGETMPAVVPGDTHSALLTAGRIPDPYGGTNELDVQWVGREDWSWEKSFTVESDFLREAQVFLSCDSLDTVAEVFVNGRKAGSSDNMFTRCRFDVKKLLVPGKNTVRIAFTSAENTAVSRASRLPYPVPHVLNPVQSPNRNLVRKAQCHAGWDWGPCLMVSGITGEIILGAFSDVRIDYVMTEQTHAEGRCTVRVIVEYTAAEAGRFPLNVTVGEHAASRVVTLDRGPGSASIDVAIHDPKLWWPNGCGGQPLYPLSVTLGGDSVSRKIGLRTLQLVNREDSQGLSMTFRVNGVDIFCKGANWIPLDALPQRETKDRLEHLLGSAAAVSMNMIRVWGGGKYESDDFYCLCDEKGLLVWQDMMFSCALYPASPEFLSSVEAEIRHQVKRLRDHPCIALWCGNNEDVGALTWFPESKQNRDRYIVDYDRLNEGTIGRVVDECDPTRAFWPSSPSAGRGDYSDNWHDDRRGDMHFWSVWHEGKPFSAFRGVSPRFCSEFGYQSFPSLEAIRTYAAEEDFNVTSPVMEHHQRHPRGNSIITEMFTRYFRFPQGFENFVYLSQVQQALAIRTAVEHWRRVRPVCMGTLYWQLNDNWPVCSWSSIDYTGAWKLLHYAARRFFAPLLLSGEVVGGRFEVWITNDLLEDRRLGAVITVLDFDGSVIRQEAKDVRARAASAALVEGWPLAELVPAPQKAFIHLALDGDSGPGGEIFLTEPKRCRLARANVTLECSQTGSGFAITLSTDKPAFFVSLFAGAIPGEFSDNCFTLLPGSPLTVSFQPRKAVSLETLRRSLSVKHLRDSY